MPDLGHTQTEWTRFAGREMGSCLLAPLRELREVSDKFRRDREQVRLGRDVSGFLDETVGVTIAGADPGTNCTVLGRFYVRITGGPTYTVALYKATGGGSGDKVAEGSGAAGASVTLAAQNSSGVTGTWELPGSVSTTSGDELWIDAVVDYRLRLDRVFTQTDSVEDDADSRAVLNDAYLGVANAVDRAKEALKSAGARFLLSNGRDNPIARGNEFLESSKASLISDQGQDDGSGKITRLRDGLFPRMSSSMAGETTGGAQSVVKTVPSAAAGVFDGDNDGQGSVASHTPGESCPPIKVTFICVAGADTGDLGSEQFRGEISFTKDGDERRISLPELLTIKKAYTGRLEFGPITLQRTLTKTGDGSDNIFTAASNATVTGETNANTDDGVLHWETTGSGPYTINFYRSSSLASGELVAQATGITSGSTFTASEANNSGIEVSWQLGGTESATTGTLKLNPFRVQRSNDRLPDQFSVTVTLAANPGLYQTTVAEEFPGASLNSATSGSETIEDDYVKQGTFAEYAVLDN